MGDDGMELVGKTYSLYGAGSGSDRYYQCVHELGDALLAGGHGPHELLNLIRQYVGSKRRLKRLHARPFADPPAVSLLQRLHNELDPFTTGVAWHLAGLTFAQRWDRTLAMSEEQYQLSMIEIEIRNRTNVAAFRRSGLRLAFLPHCLHDLQANCRSARRGEDNVCKGCTSSCTLNRVSKLLRRHAVTPYIWMTADLPTLFRRLKRQGKSVGVLGMACIPELARGMRLCDRAGVPAVGIPLDANRCARWWGTFRPNSVNICELEDLLGLQTLQRPPASERRAHPPASR